MFFPSHLLHSTSYLSTLDFFENRLVYIEDGGKDDEMPVESKGSSDSMPPSDVSGETGKIIRGTKETLEGITKSSKVKMANQFAALFSKVFQETLGQDWENKAFAEFKNNLLSIKKQVGILGYSPLEVFKLTLNVIKKNLQKDRLFFLERAFRKFTATQIVQLDDLKKIKGLFPGVKIKTKFSSNPTILLPGEILKESLQELQRQIFPKALSEGGLKENELVKQVDLGILSLHDYFQKIILSHIFPETEFHPEINFDTLGLNIEIPRSGIGRDIYIVNKQGLTSSFEHTKELMALNKFRLDLYLVDPEKIKMIMFKVLTDRKENISNRILQSTFTKPPDAYTKENHKEAIKFYTIFVKKYFKTEIAFVVQKYKPELWDKIKSFSGQELLPYDYFRKLVFQIYGQK